MRELLKKTYDELVEYLLEKYGPVEGDYFLTEDTLQKNPLISRVVEGLLIHHIDADKAPRPFDPANIKHYNLPFAWQKADRLVYCDLLERLLLKVKISEHPNKDQIPDTEVGIIIALGHLTPELNDIYSGIDYSTSWKRAIANRVIDRRDEYFMVLEHLKKIGVTYEQFSWRKSFPKNATIWNPENNNKLMEEIKEKIWETSDWIF